ncbi:MAG: lipopolysaccharide biosynthesis protein, partial [candidate division WOR-3 bacterium]
CDRDMMNSSLRSAAARGAVWTAVAQIGGQLVMLGVNVVLARLVSPAEFGTASMALVSALVLSAVTQMGLGAAIVQRPKLEARHYDTAIWMSVLTGAGLGVAFCASAVPMANLLKNPALVPVLRLYSALFLLGGMSSVQGALLTREFRFRDLALAGLGARLAGALVSVGLAFLGLGVMAIAWGYVALNTLNAVLTMVLSRQLRRPGGTFSLAALKEMLGFGSGIMGMNLLNQLANGLDVLVVGRVMGASNTGFYSVANQLVTYVPSRLGATLSTVAFPAMARVQEDKPRLARAYLELTGFTALVTLPMLAGTAVLARDLVPLLFSAKWSSAAVLVPALSVYGAVVAFDWVWTQALKALGRSWSIAGIVGLRAVGLVAAVVLGARLGLAGVAWAVAGSGLVYWLAYQLVVGRALGLGLGAYCRVLARPLAGSVLAGLVMAGFRGHLAGAIVAGVVVYCLAALTLNRKVVRRLFGMAKGERQVANSGQPCV